VRTIVLLSVYIGALSSLGGLIFSECVPVRGMTPGDVWPAATAVLAVVLSAACAVLRRVRRGKDAGDA
jgi:hypothetical protein